MIKYLRSAPVEATSCDTGDMSHALIVPAWYVNIFSGAIDV